MEKFIPTIINKIQSNQKVPIYGNGRNVREWIYVKSLVEDIYYISQKENLIKFITSQVV